MEFTINAITIEFRASHVGKERFLGLCFFIEPSTYNQGGLILIPPLEHTETIEGNFDYLVSWL